MSANDDGYKNDDLVRKFFSRAPSMSVGGKASDQPKRTPVSQEEIESIMVCKMIICGYVVSLLLEAYKVWRICSVIQLVLLY